MLLKPPDHITARERCSIVRLALTDFRCYEQLKLGADCRPAVLTGPNGAGKTNILEAISFLAPGRGLRRARMQDVTRNDKILDSSPGTLRWAISTTLETSTGNIKIGTGFENAGNGEDGGRRVVRLDESNANSHAMLGEVLAIVWLLPEMDRLFTGNAEARRRFLDRLVAAFDPKHITRLNNYTQAMRERTRLLRDDRAGLRNVDMDWVSALEQRMVQSGIALAAARWSFVSRLGSACKLVVGSFPAAGLSLIGDVETWLDQYAALEAEDCFRTALSESRIPDREAGRALIGPHRSDFAVTHLSKNQPAAICSTGEQKALLISIVLAHARLVALDRGVPPLLLMDEIVAHLDAERRAALFDEICSIGAQAWMTGTDRTLFNDLGDRAQYFHVENAIVHTV